MKDQRERDLTHLKLMIDYQRHLGLLSFAGFVLIANLTTKIYSDPNWELFAYCSGLSFLIAIISSMLAQIHHIDLSPKEVIYQFPLKWGFAIPIAFTMCFSLLGIFLMGVFAALNWS